MSALAAILLGAAADLAVPIVKKILGDAIGGKGGELAGHVIDTVAEKIGVPAQDIPEMIRLDPDRVEGALLSAEAVAPELVLAHVESQRLMNENLKAEQDKGGPAWAWAWRPAWMWLLAAIWTYALVLRPLVNAAAGAAIEPVDLSVLMTLTGAYLALYMGGHTAKALFDVKWKSGR